MRGQCSGKVIASSLQRCTAYNQLFKDAAPAGHTTARLSHSLPEHKGWRSLLGQLIPRTRQKQPQRNGLAGPAAGRRAAATMAPAAARASVPHMPRRGIAQPPSPAVARWMRLFPTPAVGGNSGRCQHTDTASHGRGLIARNTTARRVCPASRNISQERIPARERVLAPIIHFQSQGEPGRNHVSDHTGGIRLRRRLSNNFHRSRAGRGFGRVLVRYRRAPPSQGIVQWPRPRCSA